VFISTLAVEKLPYEYPPTNQTQMLAASIQPIVAFMVLCSITVHGLSIPGFSLGRRVHSVSRTWSRHAPPDWTTQARHVERGGDDIVINRDEDMERGELPAADEKLSIQRNEDSTRQSSSLSGSERRSMEERRDDGGEDTRIRASGDVGELEKEENPPDGDETVLEWKEGNDKIVERRDGPGEEVRRILCSLLPCCH
jgi:hypothetical protein